MGLLVTGLFAIGAFCLSIILLYIVFADSASAGGTVVLPEKELLFGEGFVDLFDVGAKTITIRRGRRDFEPGELVIGVCAEGDRFLLEIVSCEVTFAFDVSEADLRDNGFFDLDDFFAGMRRYYTDLAEYDEVTSIRFKVIGREVES